MPVVNWSNPTVYCPPSQYVNQVWIMLSGLFRTLGTMHAPARIMSYRQNSLHFEIIRYLVIYQVTYSASSQKKSNIQIREWMAQYWRKPIVFSQIYYISPEPFHCVTNLVNQKLNSKLRVDDRGILLSSEPSPWAVNNNSPRVGNLIMTTTIL